MCGRGKPTKISRVDVLSDDGDCLCERDGTRLQLSRLFVPRADLYSTHAGQTQAFFGCTTTHHHLSMHWLDGACGKVMSYDPVAISRA